MRHLDVYFTNTFTQLLQAKDEGYKIIGLNGYILTEIF